VSDLTQQVQDFRPTKVFVSHAADQNQDHLALYLFTQVALWNLRDEIRPQVYTYLVHFPGWPVPNGLAPDSPLDPPVRLAGAIRWLAHPLTPVQEDRKLAAIKAHRTQYGASARYLTSFVRTNELFGDFAPIELRSGGAGITLPAPGTAQTSAPPPEQLTESELARFVGFESRTVRLEGDELVVSIRLSKPLAPGVGASIYVFGYRSDRPFQQMPKLHLQLGGLGYSLYDQDTLLPKETVQVSRTPREITVRIPLSVLGDPQTILTSARTYIGQVPLTTLSWRILELNR
jgi:hypothetical protein